MLHPFILYVWMILGIQLLKFQNIPEKKDIKSLCMIRFSILISLRKLRGDLTPRRLKSYHSIYLKYAIPNSNKVFFHQ